MDDRNIDYKELGVRISNRRRKLGLKQADVNEMIGFSDKYLSHVESGKTAPSLEALIKICTALETTPDYLLLGTVRSDSDEEFIREKIKVVTGKHRISLLSNFIDWLVEQNL